MVLGKEMTLLGEREKSLIMDENLAAFKRYTELFKTGYQVTVV